MITKQTTIKNLLEQHPEVMEILLDHGIECIECHASPNESIEEGFFEHGMTDDEIGQIIDDLNKEISIRQNKTKNQPENKQIGKCCGSDSCCGGSNCE